MRLHREQQSKKIENHREKSLKTNMLPKLNSVAPYVNSRTIQKAHRLIDEGGGIKNPIDFLAEFETSRQDRPLPFRD